ncbi:MAG: tautomerase family protein [Marmoricola sp.]
MPSTVIEVRRTCTETEEVALVDAVHAALVEAFRIPPGDRHVRLVVHEPHRFAVPPHLAQPDRATMVTVDCFAGRSVDAKRALYAGVVDRLAALGVPRDHVTIIVRDLPTESWGIRGGQAACDVDLGFDVNV